jgi:hypothetical protein
MNNTITSHPQLSHDQEENDDEIYDDLQLIESEYDDEYDVYDDDCHSILSTVWEESRSDYDSSSISNSNNDSLSEMRYVTPTQERRIKFQGDDRWGNAVPCSPSDQLLISPVRRRCKLLASSDEEDSLEGKLLASEDFKQDEQCLDHSNTTCATEQSSISTFESSMPVVSFVDYRVCEDIKLPQNDFIKEGTLQSQTSDISNVDDMSTTIQEGPINFHESRSILFKHLQRRHISDHFLAIRGKRNDDGSLSGSSQSRLNLQIKIKLEQFGGDRQWKAFAKNKKLFENHYQDISHNHLHVQLDRTKEWERKNRFTENR